jgi:four helix bundle protein
MTTKFEDLDVWKRSLALSKNIYKIVMPKDEQYCLQSQMRRAMVSVLCNIGEGCGRRGSTESAYFMQIARGSLFEVRACILLAKELGYTTEDYTKDFDDLGMMLFGLYRKFKDDASQSQSKSTSQ